MCRSRRRTGYAGYFYEIHGRSRKRSPTSLELSAKIHGPPGIIWDVLQSEREREREREKRIGLTSQFPANFNEIVDRKKTTPNAPEISANISNMMQYGRNHVFCKRRDVPWFCSGSRRYQNYRSKTWRVIQKTHMTGPQG